MKRQFDPAAPELMDRPQPISRELEKDLHNLRQLNRFFGSHSLTRQFLRRWLRPGATARILDLATASGDIPRLAVDFAREIGATVTVDAVEQQESTLAIARGLSAGYPEINYQLGDVRQWEAAKSYDIVLCSLALHHFSEEDAVQLLRRCRELSQRCVLVSDLERSAYAAAGVFLLTTFLYREPMTREDARVSVERAFSFQELRTLAERAGWTNFQHRHFRFARQAIWLED